MSTSVTEPTAPVAGRLPESWRRLLADYLLSTRRLCTMVRTGDLETAAELLEHRLAVIEEMAELPIEPSFQQRIAVAMAAAERRAGLMLGVLEEAAEEVEVALEFLGEHRRGSSAFRHTTHRPDAGSWLDCSS